MAEMSESNTTRRVVPKKESLQKRDARPMPTTTASKATKVPIKKQQSDDAQLSLSEKIFVGLTAFACAEALSRTLAGIMPASDAALHLQRAAPGACLSGVGVGLRAGNKPMGNAVIIGGVLHIVKNYI